MQLFRSSLAKTKYIVQNKASYVTHQQDVGNNLTYIGHPDDQRVQCSWTVPCQVVISRMCQNSLGKRGRILLRLFCFCFPVCLCISSPPHLFVCLSERRQELELQQPETEKGKASEDNQGKLNFLPFNLWYSLNLQLTTCHTWNCTEQ